MGSAKLSSQWTFRGAVHSLNNSQVSTAFKLSISSKLSATFKASIWACLQTDVIFTNALKNILFVGQPEMILENNFIPMQVHEAHL